MQNDPLLEKRRRELIVSSCRSLDKARMVRFDEKSEALHSTSLGRTASHFYIKYSTIEVWYVVLLEMHSTYLNDSEFISY